MPKTKRYLKEERSLLLGNEEGAEFSHPHSYPAFETAVAMGVSKHVGNWPSHLFAAFLAASLVFAIFILFALVTALFCVPTANYKCRRARSIDFPEFPNVYFVKHENRTWSQTELCYVESSARDNPKTNVYLINLLSDLPETIEVLPATDGNSEKEMLVLLDQSKNTSGTSSNIEIETKIRKVLEAGYRNVRNIDVTIKDFFKGSMLANVYNKLDVKTLEIAAKANILWKTPGIALDPSDFHLIDRSKGYLCKRGCSLIKTATINYEGSFQASGVPCQAFIGYLIRQVATNGISNYRDIVQSARYNFCQRLTVCPGLKVHNDSREFSKLPNCPTTYPADDPLIKMGRFTPLGTAIFG